MAINRAGASGCRENEDLLVLAVVFGRVAHRPDAAAVEQAQLIGHGEFGLAVVGVGGRPMAAHHDVDLRSQAVVVLTGFTLTNGSGRLVSGFFSDRFGRSRTMAISFTCAAAAYLFMPHVEGIWVWATLAAVIGFAFGTLFAVSAPIAGDCFGMAHFGAIFGLIFTAYGFLSGPLGPWLSGYVLDRTQGNYTLVFSYLGVMYLASAGLILMVQPWRECRL